VNLYLLVAIGVTNSLLVLGIRNQVFGMGRKEICKLCVGQFLS
jgi:hypothetical protein